MTDTVAYTSTILKKGAFALYQALATKTRIPVGRFRVGDSFGFSPDSNATDPSGNLVYTGDLSKIGLSIIDQDQVRITLNFTEEVGDFQIGNIIIDLQLDDGTFIPFVFWVSDIPIPKNKFDSILGKIGNRYAFSFTEEFQNIEDALNITVTPVVYGSLPQYTDQNSLPPANAALFQTAVLQNYSTLFAPALVARRSTDEHYFGFAMLDQLESPFFGQFDCGFAGYINAPYTGDWYWAAYFDTDDSEYDPDPLSGGTFTTSDADYGDTLTGEALNYGAQ